MTYDLVVWDGGRPTSDKAAAATFHEFMDALEVGYDDPPLPTIVAYLAALDARWPEDPPFAALPLLDDAVGPVAYFAITRTRAEDAVQFCVATAHEMGLVCFDPQVERAL